MKIKYSSKIFLLLFSFLIFPGLALSQEIDQTLFAGYDAAFVMVNRATHTTLNIDPARGQERLTPCSTFKIYNTLIGLELGLIQDPDAPWYHWDGIKRNYEDWNQDLNLRKAFKVSAVPAFQILARNIGLERMKDYIARIKYGNQDLSSGVDTFWLPREGKVSVKISAVEQVELLNQLFDGQLPFSKNNIQVLQDVMLLVKTNKGTLYGKTGSGTNDEGKPNLGWFVGFVDHQGIRFVFACNIKNGDNPSGKTARAIVQNVLMAQGLL